MLKNSFVLRYISNIAIIAILVFLLLLNQTSCSQEITPENNRQSSPNVIFIYVDDFNYNQVGCYGGNVSTPNIDKLANEGVKFSHYYPCSSLCTPSRFSALTGRYPSRSLSLLEKFPTDDSAFIQWGEDIIEGEPTIAHLMKQHGYATGFAGKLHNSSEGLLPLLHVPDHENPESPSIRSRIEENYELTSEHVKKTSGFDFVEAVYATNLKWLPITEKLMYHNQHWITYNSLKFIEQNKDKPFFLYMATTLVHHPQAIESLRSDPRATPAGFLTEHLDCQPSYENILERADKAGLKSTGELNTWATMSWLDDGVGATLKKLDELGLRENTMIIFASDNDSPGKTTCYQGRAPFIVNWEGHIKKGEICNELVSNVDIVPTALAICNVKKAADIKIDGLSLTPLLQKSNYSWRNSLYMEVAYTRAIVTKDYKYIALWYPKDIQRLITKTNRREFTHEGFHLNKNQLVHFNIPNIYPG